MGNRCSERLKNFSMSYTYWVAEAGYKHISTNPSPYTYSITLRCQHNEMMMVLKSIYQDIWIYLSISSLYSSTLAWKILWTEEPGRLQSMGSLRVGHDWTTSLTLFTFLHWRRKWQPTPVFLPGESQGQGSLVGCRLWDLTELDMTEVTQQQQFTVQP